MKIDKCQKVSNIKEWNTEECYKLDPNQKSIEDEEDYGLGFLEGGSDQTDVTKFTEDCIATWDNKCNKLLEPDLIKDQDVLTILQQKKKEFDEQKFKSEISDLSKKSSLEEAISDTMFNYEKEYQSLIVKDEDKNNIIEKIEDCIDKAKNIKDWNKLKCYNLKNDLKKIF